MKSLLHVEDAETMIRAVELMLKTQPINYSYVYNGKQALELLKKESYDLILLDIDMPIMDGLTFLKEYTTKGSNTLIMVCSARHDLSSIHEAIRLGAADYIMKPFTDDILFMKLKQLGIL
ncbi:response regulator [bacterium]|nr:MAG: response regulator [bacterium]